MNFNKYFKGSYGWDNYSKFLIVIAMLFLLAQRTFAGGIFIIAYVLWRSFSKDKYKRIQENMMFEGWLKKIHSYFNGIRQKLNKSKQNFINNRKFAVLSCPKCSAKLRLPRRKGNLIVTCKVCHNEFRVKT
ncbi:MAG: hypothetical protein AB7G87_01585 [Clostridia bacterium]